MRKSVTMTLDEKLIQKIDTLRHREKRSTFVEHLIKLGLKTYKKTRTRNKKPQESEPSTQEGENDAS